MLTMVALHEPLLRSRESLWLLLEVCIIGLTCIRIVHDSARDKWVENLNVMIHWCGEELFVPSVVRCCELTTPVASIFGLYLYGKFLHFCAGCLDYRGRG